MTKSSADDQTDPVDAHLIRLLDDERQHRAADDRRSRSWARQVAAESGTLAGVLVDLGERGEAVAIRTTSGRTTHGRVHQVGADFVGVEQAGGAMRLVALASLTAVHSQPRSDPSAGDRAAVVDRLAVTLVDVVATLAAERRRAMIVTTDREVVAGRLVGSGQDLVAMISEAGHRSYVAVQAISEVTEVPVR